MRRLLLLLALAAPAARAAEPAVVFYAGEREVFRTTAADLRARKGTRIVEVFDAAYDRRKRYRAAPIKDLLTAAFGPSWIEDGLGEMFFEQADGVIVRVKVPRMADDGGMLAFEDADAPGWEARPQERTAPGPFALVWTGQRQRPSDGYPWATQILSVKSALDEEAFPKAVPRNVPLKSRAPAGWTVFKTRCVSCHAMSGSGGALGPDLNEPRGITSDHEKKYLRSYIRKSSAHRRGRMPDFEDLTEDEVEDLLKYFDFMAVQAGTK